MSWQILSEPTTPANKPPSWLTSLIQTYAPDSSGQFAAQLLWQRGWRDRDRLTAFLDPTQYSPCSPFAFAGEMRQACDRLLQAQQNQEKVAIWGDFDADGVTATAVLWEGLSHWFPQETQLTYYIPNRRTESHGLSGQGLTQLHEWGATLIVTCDTGSTDLDELAEAQQLGMDVIVTDHHSLLPERPPVVAIVNPRSLTPEHPLADLSGVAVAYKLIEALYSCQSELVDRSHPLLLETLLPLVAIGLIADLVALKGDCRYLAQLGLWELQKLTRTPEQRPGVAYLLERCKRSGDRPTDISFGIGPRINAVSRILGNADLCVELLTSRDSARCKALVNQVELLNSRRKALQRELERQVKAKLVDLDLSTTGAIVLGEVGWPIGVLGLVAGQIARDYGKPTVLFSLDEPVADATNPQPTTRLARGSARSINNINFYPILETQRHLLTGFGGHPFAAGMSLPVENLELFTQGINQAMRVQGISLEPPPVQADLSVTVADLGNPLFRELKLLEPCGMGNPIPKLLIQNCCFINPINFNIKDHRGGKLRYIKTIFEISDASATNSFPGIWWGHYRDELPEGPADALGELDFNTQKRQYEFRLVAVRPAAAVKQRQEQEHWILDWRNTDSPLLQPLSQAWEMGEIAGGLSSNPSSGPPSPEIGGKGLGDGGQHSLSTSDANAGHGEPTNPREVQPESMVSPGIEPVVMAKSPQRWDDFRPWVNQAQSNQRPLALAYQIAQDSAMERWETLLGIAKYLRRTGKTVSLTQMQAKVELDASLWALAWPALRAMGFEVERAGADRLLIKQTTPDPASGSSQAIPQFLSALREAIFQQHYFAQVSVTEIEQLTQAMFLIPN